MRVLVCGGRTYADRESVFTQLDALGPDVVIHGGATGADALAGEWSQIRGVECRVYPADWARYGRRAGPIRNRQMLDGSRPDRVVAFPGGAGTAHMTRIASESGYPVIEIWPSREEGA